MSSWPFPSPRGTFRTPYLHTSNVFSLHRFPAASLHRQRLSHRCLRFLRDGVLMSVFCRHAAAYVISRSGMHKLLQSTRSSSKARMRLA
eukprot:6200039-Pleurochrysis_carterae.AAC.1